MKGVSQVLIRTNKTKGLFFALFLLTAFSISAFGAILFEDDFGSGNLDKWENVKGQPLEVTKDPDDGGNQVCEQNIEIEGPPLPIPKGSLDEGWTDYIWEYDLRWVGDPFVGNGYRYQGPTNYFHGSRRVGGSYSIFIWNGGFAELNNQPWASDGGVWYRLQLSVIGDEHIVKTKERDDETPFDELDPILKIKDNTYKDGPIGLFGAEGMMFWDNIIVYEPGTNIRAVKPRGKLTTTWGGLKSDR